MAITGTLLLGIGRVQANDQAVAPIEVTGIPQLLLHDDRLIEERQDVVLTHAQPEKYAGNPIITNDKPWEDGKLGYACVIHDVEERLYKMWYEMKDDRDHGQCLYAISKDGIKWQKPILNVVEHNGSPANNIVFGGPNRTRAKAYWVVKDYSESDSGKRYKMMYHLWDFRGRGIGIAYSPDGIRWTSSPNTKLTGGFDSQNIMFWDDRIGKFAGYFRNWVGNRRWIARAESNDGFHWSAPVTIHGPDGQDPPTDWDIYTPGAFKLSRTHDVYIMMPAIFDHRSHSVYAQLGLSRDGIHWFRFRDSFIPPGNPEDWDAKVIYPVPSEAVIDGRTAIYYFGGDIPHGRSDIADLDLANTSKPKGRTAIGLAFMREAGYAGWKANVSGWIRTRALTANHARYHFYLNADASRGSIQIELLDRQNRVLPGFGRQQSKPIKEDGQRVHVQWTDMSKLSTYLNSPVKLNIHLENATVYGFGFRESPDQAPRETPRK